MTKQYRLAVIKTANGRQLVVEQNGRLLPASKLLKGKRDQTEMDDLAALLTDWVKDSAAIEQAIAENAALFESEGVDAASAKFEAPLAKPGKIVCIGSNFHDHIAEMAIPMTPSYPYSFMKPVNNTVRGSGDGVAKPRRSEMMDWEAELGVVIGAQCVDVPKEKALSVVAGYLNFNDLSSRDWLASRPPVGVDWVQHKAFDGYAPFGPYLVPAKFIADPQDLPMRLTVNGVLKQNSSTAQMVFGVAAIIEHLTSIMTLYPGDIIATGTPAGVGHGAKPPQYLKSGDVIELEIGPLGKLVTPII